MPEGFRGLELQTQIISKLNAIIQKIDNLGLDDLEEINHRLDVVSVGYVEVCK